VSAVVVVAGALTLVAAASSCAPSRAASPRVLALTHAARRPTPGPGRGRWFVVEALGRRLRGLVGRAADPSRDRRLGIVVAGALMAGVVSPVLAVPVIAGAWIAPVLGRRRRRHRADAQLLAAAPDLVELFRSALAAGMTIYEAIDPVAARAPAVTADALGEIRSGLAVGRRLADLLDRLGRDHEPLRPLAAALASGERYGTELAPVLERVGADARDRRRRHAEEQARRIPVRMLFPLVLCILPAFGLLTVVPLLLSAISGLPR